MESIEQYYTSYCSDLCIDQSIPFAVKHSFIEIDFGRVFKRPQWLAVTHTLDQFAHIFTGLSIVCHIEPSVLPRDVADLLWASVSRVVTAPSLSELSVQQVTLTQRGARLLTAALSARNDRGPQYKTVHRRLSTFSLSDVSLTDATASLLCHALLRLRPCPPMAVSFARCNLRGACASLSALVNAAVFGSADPAWRESLREEERSSAPATTSLTKLSVAGNSLTDAFVSAIAEALESAQFLSSLDFSGNCFTVAGISATVKALASCSSPYLSYCNLGFNPGTGALFTTGPDGESPIAVARMIGGVVAFQRTGEPGAAVFSVAPCASAPPLARCVPPNLFHQQLVRTSEAARCTRTVSSSLGASNTHLSDPPIDCRVARRIARNIARTIRPPVAQDRGAEVAEPHDTATTSPSASRKECVSETAEDVGERNEVLVVDRPLASESRPPRSRPRRKQPRAPKPPFVVNGTTRPRISKLGSIDNAPDPQMYPPRSRRVSHRLIAPARRLRSLRRKKLEESQQLPFSASRSCSVSPPIHVSPRSSSARVQHGVHHKSPRHNSRGPSPHAMRKLSLQHTRSADPVCVNDVISQNELLQQSAQRILMECMLAGKSLQSVTQSPAKASGDHLRVLAGKAVPTGDIGDRPIFTAEALGMLRAHILARAAQG